MQCHKWDNMPWYKYCIVSFYFFLYPDSKIHVAHIGPTWVLAAPGRHHVGHKNLAITVCMYCLTVTGGDSTKVPAHSWWHGVAPYSRIAIRISAVVWYFVHRGIGKSWCHVIVVPMWRMRSPPLAWQPWYCHVRITSVREASECSSTCHVGGSHWVEWIQKYATISVLHQFHFSDEIWLSPRSSVTNGDQLHLWDT